MYKLNCARHKLKCTKLKIHNYVQSGEKKIEEKKVEHGSKQKECNQIYLARVTYSEKQDILVNFLGLIVLIFKPMHHPFMQCRG